ANNWCYEQATYRSTSPRTASPVTVYKGGFGRCGEESTFLTTILRSLGIPSRQVYVPRWSHSDSNHAWVEVFLEDGWHFTGACEPKPIMDNGWFPYAASRAMVVHSRLFDNLASTDEEVTEMDGGVVLLNESARYLKESPLKVRVYDKFQQPIKGATVRFEIVNSAEFFPVAALKTDEKGECNIKLGCGDVHIQVLHEGKFEEVFCDLRTENAVNVVFSDVEKYFDDVTKYHINAPESDFVAGNDLTPEMDAEQNAKNAIGDKIRNDRIDSYFDKDYAAKFKDYKKITKVLENSKGNFDEIRGFLDADVAGITLAHKDKVLGCISEKDARDIKKEVLLDALSAFEFKDNYPEEIFDHFVLSPRIFLETATPFRKYIRENCKEYTNDAVNDPAKLYRELKEKFKYYPEKEYTTIFSTPEGMLKVGSGTPDSLGILFCAILRTFGVPARMDMYYGKPQYFKNGKFIYAEEEYEPKAVLELVSNDKKAPEYGRNYTLARKNNDGAFETIGAWMDGNFENREAKFNLAVGEYRILTCERMASGSISGKMLYISLDKGEKKSYKLSCDEVRPEEFIKEKDIPDIVALSAETGKETNVTSFEKGKRGLLMFAEPGKEPTEHVFNELLEISRMGGFPECCIRLVLRNENALTDPTLIKIRNTYKNLEIYYSDLEELVKILEEKTDVSGKNLPYNLVAEGKNKSIYCVSGYNVGCVDIFAKIIRG
ncbi:MAG: transglutaminase domain-containing protein, partial [Lachnospiraceae bacterium]|nr:transglutaminase domain-containing protein [Lachnospiraceae bacterium]